MARNPMQNQGGRVFRCQQLVVTLDRTGISGVKQLLEHFTAIEQHVSLTAMDTPSPFRNASCLLSARDSNLVRMRNSFESRTLMNSWGGGNP